MTENTQRNRTLDKKRGLLDAAERVYFRDGDLGLTVRRIAAEGRTTSQTIYTYFGSRDAVVEGMYDRAVSGLNDLVKSFGSAAPHAEPRVRSARFGAMMADYRRYCLQYPARFRMLVTGTGPGGTDPQRVIGVRTALVSALGSTGSVTADDDTADRGGESEERSVNGDGDDRTARVALSAINGFIEAELDRFLSYDDDLNVLFDRLVRLLSTPGAGASDPATH